MTQHVATPWSVFATARGGPFTTSCGIRGWRGAGPRDPLCAVCARKHGLEPGMRTEPERRSRWT